MVSLLFGEDDAITRSGDVIKNAPPVIRAGEEGDPLSKRRQGNPKTGRPGPLLFNDAEAQHRPVARIIIAYRHNGFY